MAILKKNEYQIESVQRSESDDRPRERSANKIIKDLPGLANTVIKLPHQRYVQPAPIEREPVAEPIAPAFNYSPAPDLPPVPTYDLRPEPAVPQPAPQPVVSDAYIKELEAKAQASLSQKQSEFEREVAQRRAQLDHELNEYKNRALAEAEAKKKSILDQAYQDGLARGKADAKADYGKKAQELMQAIAGLADEKSKIVRQAKPEILKLALAIAHQMVKSEISLNQAVTLNIVSEAIEKVTDNTKVIIRVNRADVEFLKLNQDRIAQQLGDVKNLIIQEDGRIETGGCIIETNLGYIDATVQTKFDAIKQAINTAMEDEDAVPVAERKARAAKDKQSDELDVPEWHDDYQDTHDQDADHDHDDELDHDHYDDEQPDDAHDEFETESDDEFAWDDEDDEDL